MMTGMFNKRKYVPFLRCRVAGLEEMKIGAHT